MDPALDRRADGAGLSGQIVREILVEDVACGDAALEILIAVTAGGGEVVRREGVGRAGRQVDRSARAAAVGGLPDGAQDTAAGARDPTEDTAAAVGAPRL